MTIKMLMEKDSDRLARQQAIEYLRIRLKPEEHVLNSIQSVRDLYWQRTILRQIHGTDAIVSHVAQVIINGIDNGHRMRTLDCLKVLRSLTQSVESSSLSFNTTEKLFRIYQNFIFARGDEIQWCVSAILKGKLLADNAVEWLVQNCTRSDHIINRLLLYPTIHSRITEWAEKAYRDDLIPERCSELIALLINATNDDVFARENGPNVIVWAIFKARISDEEKAGLLKKYCIPAALKSVVEVADRLGLPEVLSYFLEKLENQQRTTTWWESSNQV